MMAPINSRPRGRKAAVPAVPRQVERSHPGAAGAPRFSSLLLVLVLVLVVLVVVVVVVLLVLVLL